MISLLISKKEVCLYVPVLSFLYFPSHKSLVVSSELGLECILEHHDNESHIDLDKLSNLSGIKNS